MHTAQSETQPGNDTNSAAPPAPTDPQAVLYQLRADAVARYRPLVASVASPIRLMARMVNEVRDQALKLNIPQDALNAGLVNRTIGDVNVRTITEVVDGVDYSTIGEDLGIIMPGETINGRVSDGATYSRVRERMGELERMLLDQYDIDLRIYDVFALGNPVLREQLAARFRDHFGIPAVLETTYCGVGALDVLDKTTRALNAHFRQKYGQQVGYCFPAPGFGVTRWQAENLGMEVITYQTSQETNFKLTAEDMAQLLADHENLRVLYLTISNNPTAFSYSKAELSAIFAAIAKDGRELAILADMAYVGTGGDGGQNDLALMEAFREPDTLKRTIFVNSLSKTFTLTGDRMGFGATFNPEWAPLFAAAWNNTMAGLPAEWQLRYMVYLELFEQNPALQDKIRRLYAMRRDNLRQQLRDFNQRYNLFDIIGLDDNTTVYNWSKFRAGENVFTLFEKTGVAGVDGRGFGYDEQYVRFSVGFTPLS